MTRPLGRACGVGAELRSAGSWCSRCDNATAAVSDTACSFDGALKTAVCPTSCSLDIHELQSVDTPLQLRKRPFPTSECAFDARCAVQVGANVHQTSGLQERSGLRTARQEKKAGGASPHCPFRHVGRCRPTPASVWFFAALDVNKPIHCWVDRNRSSDDIPRKL